MKDKGYTLVELLAVIAILGIISTIAVGSYLNHIHRTRQISYESAESSLKGAAESVLIDCSISISSSKNILCDYYKMPDVGKSISIKLSDLIFGGYMEEVSDPGVQGDVCDASKSHVVITNQGGEGASNYNLNYQSCLYCSEYQTEGCTFS